MRTGRCVQGKDSPRDADPGTREDTPQLSPPWGPQQSDERMAGRRRRGAGLHSPPSGSGAGGFPGRGPGRPPQNTPCGLTAKQLRSDRLLRGNVLPPSAARCGRPDKVPVTWCQGEDRSLVTREGWPQTGLRGQSSLGQCWSPLVPACFRVASPRSFVSLPLC